MRTLITTVMVLLALAALLLVIDRGREETSAEPPFGEVGPETTSENPTSETASQSQSKQKTKVFALNIINSAGERVPLAAEVAETPRQRERGLMGRTALGENQGMLFVFEQEQPLSFWMRNTLIPLSIAYIDGRGTIVDIQDMEPLDETSHPSAAPARYALEVNQGFFEEHGIRVGDILE
jgi:uncharacterized membrane protein (UPF0127 family)